MRNDKGQFQPGSPPGPGRRTALKTKLAEEFSRDAIIEAVRELKRTNPAGYIKLALELAGSQRSLAPPIVHFAEMG